MQKKRTIEQIAVNDIEFANRYPSIFENNSSYPNGANSIYMVEILTPLGPMLAGATSKGICLLEFIDRTKLGNEFTELQRLLNASILPGRTKHHDLLEYELNEYFKGELKSFSVPLHTLGNEFSQSVWKALQEIPYGKTTSYKKQSEMMNNPKAIRAIASTNGRNRLAIIIPCHRVIGSNGALKGYAAGLEKKKWLLKFELEHSEKEEGFLF